MLNVLRNSSRIVAGFAAVVLALSLASGASAADGKGKVTGKVLGKDGAGVAGAQVRLTTPMEKKDKKGEKPAAADADKDKADKEKGVVAKTTSEADGSFTLADVPAGDYVLMARTKDKLMAREKVTVKSGEETKVDLKLKEGKGGKK